MFKLKGKRKRLQASKILDNNGTWLENQDNTAKEAVEFFKAQFTKDRVPTNFDIVNHTPKMITEEQNANLWA